MLHSIGHKFEKAIRGMVVKVKIEAPSGATVDPLLNKVAELFAFAAEDPDQFNLPLEKGTKEKTE
jgi:hypothetical protein